MTVEMSLLEPEDSVPLKDRRKSVDNASNLQRSLHQAARDGDVRVMRYLLDRLVGNQVIRKINQLDEDELSPLHYATRYNFYDMVTLLVENGADVNLRGEDGLSPLHFAARYKKTRTAKKISDETMNLINEDNNSEGSVTSPTQSEEPRFYLRFKNFASQSPINYSPIKKPFLHRGMFGDSKEEPRSPDSLEEYKISSSVIFYLSWKGADVNSRDNFGLTPLHYAAMRENEIAAKELIKCHTINIEAKDRQGITPLHLAAVHNSISVARLLINAGANLRSTDDVLATPLHRASMEGNVEIVQMMLEAAENIGGWVNVSQMINDLDYSSNSALHLAADNPHPDIVKILVDKGADVNVARINFVFPLHLAAVVGNTEIIQVLLENNARIDCLNSCQETPLHKASEFNHSSAIELLLTNGAKIERRDKNNFTPLLIAASKGHVSAICCLLQHDADLTAVDKNDKTAVYWASEGNHLDALIALLSHPKAEELIDRGDRYGNTPLHVASMKGYLSIVQCLLEHNAIIDQKNEEEQTSLHLAAKHGKSKVVRDLLHRCKQLANNEDEDSNTPLHLAATAGKEKVIRLLVEAGANLESRNSNQWTALDCAAAKGWKKSVCYLLDAGSTFEPMDKIKITPIHLAAVRGHAEVVRLLIERGCDVARRDDQGRNTLELAIANSHKDVAMTIIKSSQCNKALRNHTINVKTGARKTPLRYLIKKFPEVAEKVFDECISTNNVSADHPSFKVTLNYEFLDDTYIIQENEDTMDDVNASKSSIYDEDYLLKPEAEQYTESGAVIKENHPLMIMVKFKQEKLLSHPLCVSLVKMKWLRFGRYVYYINLAFYIIFLTFLSSYLLVIPKPSVNSQHSMVNFFVNNSNNSLSCSPNDTTSVSQFSTLAKFVVIVMCIISFLKEFFQMYQLQQRYLTLENLIEWSCYIMALLLCIDFTSCASITGEREIWQWELGAFSIFLAWLNLVMFIRKFPFLGIYVVMFTDVFTTFFKVFIVFFLLIIGFGLSFSIMFYNQEPMMNSGKTLLRTSVMMLGEFNYDEMFEESELLFPIPSYIIFIVFLILMPIITMNLLVGLAVDDIKGVQEQAELKRLAMQVELVLNVESVLPEFLRRRFITQRQVLQPNLQNRSYLFKNLFAREEPLEATNIFTSHNLKMEKVNPAKLEEQQEAILSRVVNIEHVVQELKTENDNLRNILLNFIKSKNLECDDADEVGSVIES